LLVLDELLKWIIDGVVACCCLIFLLLELADAIFDFLGRFLKSIVGTLSHGLHGQLLHEEQVGVLCDGELHIGASLRVEIDSKNGPLGLD
jgi:hypothetical protein